MPHTVISHTFCSSLGGTRTAGGAINLAVREPEQLRCFGSLGLDPLHCGHALLKIILRILGSLRCCRLVGVLGAILPSVMLPEMQARAVEFWQVRQWQVQQRVRHS